MKSERNVLAVDVCGTLFDTNTTAGLVRFHHKRCANRYRASLLHAITRPNGVLRFALILAAKLSHYDVHRHIVLRSLRGEANAALKASASVYAAQHLTRHTIKAAQVRLTEMRDAGWEPVLVSNAICPIVSEIATSLDLPFLASELEVIDGTLTGRLSVDLTGHKRARLEAKLGASLEQMSFAVMTDNKTDADLVEAADPAVLISAGAPKKWMRGVDAEILCH